MAFSIEEAASKAEKHSVPLNGDSSELKNKEVIAESTTSLPLLDDPKTSSTVIPENEFKFEEIQPSLTNSELINNNDEKLEEGDGNPRIVFIERLMGLHLSAPFRNSQESNSNISEFDGPLVSPPIDAFNQPSDKMNAKWATRMRKFSIPLQPENQVPLQIPQQPNPMLRYAAAAMLSRLVAAAAKAQMEAQIRESVTNQINETGKDKDEDVEEEVVPVIVATMKDEKSQVPRSLLHMYGRPVLRESKPIPFTSHQHQRQIPAMSSMPQRAFVNVPQVRQVPLREPSPIQRRTGSDPQPFLVMLALPVQPAESRHSPVNIQLPHNPDQSFVNQNQPTHMPFYPTVPYPVPYIKPNHKNTVSYAVPVHVPVPVNYPFQYHHRPVYQFPAQRPIGAYSQVQPVIEVPVEVPVPYHVPIQVPISVKVNQIPDNELTASDRDQIVLLYQGGNEDLDSASSENKLTHAPVGSQKGSFFLNHPMPSIMSPHKMKLWKEYVSEKHAAQPRVRFIPIAVATQTEEASQFHENNFGQPPVFQQPQPFSREEQPSESEQ